MRKTPLYQAHVNADARIVDFHGWAMPVQYTGILDEAKRVRTQVGIFDLCHMGRLVVRGPDREALVNRVFSGRTAKLQHGRAKYGFLLNEDGYPIDDVLIYRDVDEVHIVINATGRDTDPAWVLKQNEAGGYDATVEDVSDQQAMIALQGPASEMTLQPLCGADLSALKYYGFLTAPVCGVPCLLARTGYTGEDGFECFFPPEHAMEVWNALVGSGRSLGIAPIGLGARDTLRLEAGMPLYGQEINLEIHPLEADLGFGLGLKRTGTIGIEALAKLKAEGFPRRAVSLMAPAGRVARLGCKVLKDGAEIGVVTSGTMSPTLGTNIARALVLAEASELGSTLDVDIRGKGYPFEVVPSPFYTRKR